jgi:hypothetical protein
VQGDWVGVYGSRGYVLAAWNNTSDVVSLTGATRTLVQGSRHRWSSSTTQVRALENAAQTQRRAATFFHDTELSVRIDFTTAFTGRINIYVLDWDTTARRETVTVTCGSVVQTLTLTSSFNQGAWLHFPVSAAAGTSCTITATRTAGANAVISGIFLGG